MASSFVVIDSPSKICF